MSSCKLPASSCFPMLSQILIRHYCQILYKNGKMPLVSKITKVEGKKKKALFNLFVTRLIRLHLNSLKEVNQAPVCIILLCRFASAVITENI